MNKNNSIDFNLEGFLIVSIILGLGVQKLIETSPYIFEQVELWTKTYLPWAIGGAVLMCLVFWVVKKGVDGLKKE